MELSWVKLRTNLDTDSRAACILGVKGGDAVMFYYVRLLILAARCNSGGGLYVAEDFPHTPLTLAKQWNITENRVKKILEKLESTKLINIEDGIIFIYDWEADQSAEKLEEIRKKHREAQSRYREKQKSISEKTQKVTSPLCHSDCTEEEKEIKKEKEKELEEDGIYESVKDRFNLTAATGQKILVFSDKQKRAVKTAVDRFGEEMLYECFRLAGESEFLQGKNPKNWVPTFDWLINPDNISKVLNGNYNTLYSSAASSAPQIDPSVSSFDEDEFIEAALNRPWE